MYIVTYKIYTDDGWRHMQKEFRTKMQTDNFIDKYQKNDSIVFVSIHCVSGGYESWLT